MILYILFLTTLVLFLLFVFMVLSSQPNQPSQPTKQRRQSNQPPPLIDFVPTEAERVPTHANYSNKFNDVIGNETSGIIGEGQQEVFIPSDWYMSRYLPTEFDGPYWPRGSVEPDFIFPGSDPRRPLRSQNLYASQSQTTQPINPLS